MENKVLLIIDQMGEGGAQEVIDNLIEYFPRNNKIIIDLLICFPYPNANQRTQQLYIRPAVGKVFTPLHALLSLSKTKLVSLLLRKIYATFFLPVVILFYALKYKYTILHANLTRSTIAVSKIAFLLPRTTKTVVTIHNNYHLTFRNLEKRVFQVANLFDFIVLEIHYSTEEASLLFKRDRVVYIPFAFKPLYQPSNLNSVERLKIRREFKIFDDVNFLLSISRLTLGHKRIDKFIEMAGILKGRGVKFKLLLVGDGEDKHRLEKVTADLLLNDCIIFAGHRDDLLSLYAASDIYLSFSTDREVGIAGLQAIGCGLPVVALETLRKGKGSSGFMPFAKAYNLDDLAMIVENIINHREDWDEFIKNSSKYVHENYSASRMALDYFKLYDRIAKYNVAPLSE